MSKISIEGTQVASELEGVFSASGHLLLIYEDDGGNEYVVRGGPTPNAHYGALILELGVLIDHSADERVDANKNPVTPESRGNTEIPLNGRNADDVINLILQHAQNIHDYQFPYDPFGYTAFSAPDKLKFSSVSEIPISITRRNNFKSRFNSIQKFIY